MYSSQWSHWINISIPRINTRCFMFFKYIYSKLRLYAQRSFWVVSHILRNFKNSILATSVSKYKRHMWGHYFKIHKIDPTLLNLLSLSLYCYYTCFLLDVKIIEFFSHLMGQTTIKLCYYAAVIVCHSYYFPFCIFISEWHKIKLKTRITFWTL